MVRDVAAAKTAYGPYATPLPSDAVVSPRTMRGVKCLMLMGRPPRGLLAAALAAKVRHIILLAAAPSGMSQPSFDPYVLSRIFLQSTRELDVKALLVMEAEVLPQLRGLSNAEGLAAQMSPEPHPLLASRMRPASPLLCNKDNADVEVVPIIADCGHGSGTELGHVGHSLVQSPDGSRSWSR